MPITIDKTIAAINKTVRDTACPICRTTAFARREPEHVIEDGRGRLEVLVECQLCQKVSKVVYDLRDLDLGKKALGS